METVYLQHSFQNSKQPTSASFARKCCAIRGNAENLGGATPLHILEDVYTVVFTPCEGQIFELGEFL